MTTLLIDAGNTRVKWAYLRGGVLGAQFAVAHTQPASAGARERTRRLDDRQWRSLAKRWRAAMRRRRDPLQDVLIVSVAGGQFDSALRRLLSRELGLRAHFVASARGAAGIRNGYRDAWRLGADRWVALIGARAMLPRRALCVVDAGTAITIDLLDAMGQHRGGAIVPGPQLMVRSLLRGTSGIQRRAGGRAGGARNLFANNTQAALEAGAGHAAAAVIERAVSEARRKIGSAPMLVLTGGAAPQLRPLLRPRPRVVPELVLRGLAALAQR